MALTNRARQQRYRQKAKHAALRRVESRLPADIAVKLTYLATHWGCTKRDALARALMETWAREGHPVPGYSPQEEEDVLSGNG